MSVIEGFLLVLFIANIGLSGLNKNLTAALGWFCAILMLLRSL